MESSLTTLLICTGLKIISLIVIAAYLFRNWQHQEKRYFSDFPFLNALTFFVYAIGKGIDMFVYSFLQNATDINQLFAENLVVEIICRIRFIVSPILVVLPYLILMTLLWLNEKKKLRIILCSIWLLASVIAVLIAKTYAQMLLINQLVAFPVILLSIISFAIMHFNHRLPQLNSLLLAIGWLMFAVSQFLRNYWLSLGSGTWGLSWVGELVELSALLIIGVGFMIPAFYANKKDT